MSCACGCQALRGGSRPSDTRALQDLQLPGVVARLRSEKRARAWPGTGIAPGLMEARGSPGATPRPARMQLRCPAQQPSPLTNTAVATRRLTRGLDQSHPSLSKPQIPPWGAVQPPAPTTCGHVFYPIAARSSLGSVFPGNSGRPQVRLRHGNNLHPQHRGLLPGTAPPCSGESSWGGLNHLILGLKVLSPNLSLLFLQGAQGSSCKSCLTVCSMLGEGGGSQAA